MFNAATIDASCEREALAICTLSEWTETPNDEPMHVRLGRMVELAKRMGVNIAPHPRYPRQKVTRRWEGICAAIAANRPITRAKYALPLTAEDRQRRLVKRVHRANCLRALSQLPSRKAITLAEAAQISGTSIRRLQRLAQVGTLTARKEVKHYAKSAPGRGVYLTTVGAVRSFLASRVAA